MLNHNEGRRKRQRGAPVTGRTNMAKLDGEVALLFNLDIPAKYQAKAAE